MVGKHPQQIHLRPHSIAPECVLLRRMNQRCAFWTLQRVSSSPAVVPVSRLRSASTVAGAPDCRGDPLVSIIHCNMILYSYFFVDPIYSPKCICLVLLFEIVIICIQCYFVTGLSKPGYTHSALCAISFRAARQPGFHGSDFRLR